MSETPPDPADVHTGTDRVELTEDEREGLDRAVGYERAFGVYAMVESIVAARTADLLRWKSEAIEVIYGLQELGKALDLPLGERITGPKAVEAVQALTDERDELRASLPKRTRDWLAHCKVLDAERDAVSDQLAEAWKQLGETEAELAAANARSRELEREIDERDKAHEGIVATITAAARADTRTAKSDAAKVQMLAERVDALTLSRDKHRNRAAAANARCAELEALVEGMHREVDRIGAENLQHLATLDRISALADEWEREAKSWTEQAEACYEGTESRSKRLALASKYSTQAAKIRAAIDGPGDTTGLRAALTPEGTE